MTQVEQILNYLWSIAPDGATNSQIARALDIGSHQGVYMTTQNLMRRRRIRGEQVGKTWTFYALDEPERELAGAAPPPSHRLLKATGISPAEFETVARTVMCRKYGVAELPPGKVAGVPKEFDYVSADRQIVGDAKYYTLVGGTGLPPAKFSIIAEHVWLLEKTGASQKFLVFGNDRTVPALWLKGYGSLASGVDFYFLSGAGDLESLG